MLEGPMSPTLYLLVVALVGVGVLTTSLIMLRAAGARPGLARRLAGPQEVRVGTLLDARELPQRPVRVAGRIRCADPVLAGGGERLVAFHRDVEVRLGRGWRSVERVRESRSFELWDHDGSLSIDPARAAEPLIAIPKVWRGPVSELQEPHASAVARLSERHGPLSDARSTTRTLNVTDRLLVLANARRGDDGRVRLDPPSGGFVISSLALDDAMRLLGGGHRRVVVGGIVGVGIGLALVAIGGIGGAAALFLGA